MKRLSKKIIALLLVVAMLVPTGALGITTSAQEGIAVGDTINLGTYNGEPITWVCVDIDENGPLMMSEDVLCEKEYDAAGTDSKYHTDGWGYIRKTYGSNCWYDSNIRQWLNSNENSVSWTHCPPSYKDEAGFMTNFTVNELSYIKTVTRLVNVITYESKRAGYCEGGSKDAVLYEIYSASFLAKNYYYDYIEDNFFLLSAEQFNNIYRKNTDVLTLSSSYYTCVVSGNNANFFEVCTEVKADSASLNNRLAKEYSGIRPAFYLNEDAYSPNIYNMGEETYSFGNYGDSDSKGGHCFGMSVTSSGYYLDILDETAVGANNSRNVYSLSDSTIVREPICYYQGIQGSIRDQSMVAGGTNYKNEEEFDIATDWNEVVSYVRGHEFDNRGSLQIGYRKSGEGGHAINFLRYEVVDGQERIYAYDNNCPEKETYFYQDANGNVMQAVYSTFSGSIDCITLRNVSTYLFSVSAMENVEKYKRIAIYADDTIKIDNAERFLMDGKTSSGEQYVYEISEDITTVRIIPLEENASFTYMGQEYTFDEISEDTYAELTLSSPEEDTPVFTIINAPEKEPAEPEGTTKTCSCMCHQTGFMEFIWKIFSFLFKIFGMNQYQFCDCGKVHW